MLESLLRELELCQQLLVQIGNANNLLNNVINSYSDMSSSLQNSYIISGEETKTNQRIKSNNEEVKKLRNHLSNVTVPKVVRRIQQLQALIAAEMARLAEEAARAAAGK